MNSNGRIEHGIDTNGDSRSRKMKTTRLVGSIESGKDVISQSKRCGSARAGRRYVKTASMLLVVCAAAIVVVSALAVTETSQKTASAKGKAPGPPHPILGSTYDAVGAPLPGCVVVIRETVTGESVAWDETNEFWDPALNTYNIDMSLFQDGYTLGDLLNVTATVGTAIGWNESIITDEISGNTMINVTLDGIYTPIPEFPMAILPVGGMIALFTVVSLRRKGKEQ